MSIDDEITNIQVQINSLRLRKQALEIGRLDKLKEQNKALLEALARVKKVLGPSAPTCDGCAVEIAEALKIIGEVEASQDQRM